MGSKSPLSSPCKQTEAEGWRDFPKVLHRIIEDWGLASRSDHQSVYPLHPPQHGKPGPLAPKTLKLACMTTFVMLFFPVY